MAMSTKISLPILALAVISLIVALAVGWLPGPSEHNTRLSQANEHISLANKMRDEHLPREAVLEFALSLESPTLPKQKKSNISYLIANIYYDDLKDYEKALAYYLRAKFYDESNPQKTTIEQRIVASLEKLGRSQDAQYRLASATYLAGEQTAKYPGRVVAKIGNREITRGELEAQLEKLPPQQRAHIKDDASKLDFLRQYIAGELIYDAAKSEGLDKDQQVRDRLAQIEKVLLTDRYMQEKVQNTVLLTDTEINLYYEAHRKELAEPRRVKVAHILFDSEKAARDVLSRLKAGGDFDGVARQHSLDNATKDKGGVLGFVIEGSSFVPSIGDNKEIAESLLRLDRDTLSEVMKTEKGYHIFKILEVAPHRELTFDEAKPRIVAALRQQKESEAQQKLIEQMLKAREVVIYEGEFQTGSKNAEKK
jgi:peptidyl-prolyl cis-trans isomerase C